MPAQTNLLVQLIHMIAVSEIIGQRCRTAHTLYGRIHETGVTKVT